MIPFKARDSDLPVQTMSSLTSASNSVPIVETKRLVLRGHRIDDYADCFRLWTDESVTRFIGGRPSTQEEVWARLLRYGGLWALLGFGYWVVTEKHGGRFLGEVGFADFRREIEPSLDGTPEMGWVLAPDSQGRGYATEAVRAAIAWGDEHFGGRRMACIIAPENEASLRVAEKCGFREWQHTTYKGNPTIMFVR